jgi:hypothetical protein
MVKNAKLCQTVLDDEINAFTTIFSVDCFKNIF